MVIRKIEDVKAAFNEGILWNLNHVEAEELFGRLRGTDPTDYKALQRALLVTTMDLIALAEGKPCKGLGTVTRAKERAALARTKKMIRQIEDSEASSRAHGEERPDLLQQLADLRAIVAAAEEVRDGA